MTIKKTGLTRASRRNLSTQAFPNRKGLLNIDQISILDKVGEWKEFEGFAASITGSGPMNFTDNGNSYMEYMQIGPIVFVQGIVGGNLTGSPSNTLEVGVPILPEQVRPFDSPWTTGFAEDGGGNDIAGDVFIDRASNNRWAFNRGPTNSANWNIGTSMQVRFQGFYKCDPSVELESSTQMSIKEIVESAFFDLQDRDIEGNGLLVLTGGNGRGGSSSGEDEICNFGSTEISTGTALTLNPQTATTAQSITANEDGVYSIVFDTRGNSNLDIAITKNAKGSSDPNGSGADETATAADALIGSVTNKEIVLHQSGDTQDNNTHVPLSVTVKLKKDDVIRFHLSQDPSGLGNTFVRVEQLYRF